MRPHQVTDMANSLAKIEDAVTVAAEASGLTMTQGATLAGAWQWVWHPVPNSEDSRRIEVLATPDGYGVQVAVQVLVWRSSDVPPQLEQEKSVPPLS